MTPVSAIRASFAADAEGARRDAAWRASAPAAASSRALIPLAPITRSDASLHGRTQAGFLAHLIATDCKLPQTRERRRAEPADATAAYAAVSAETVRAGRRVFRLT